GRAERGELAFGTVDSFLLWRLTGGRVHATDVTNASRTLLYDIHAQRWDDELLALMRVPRALLPEVRDCSGVFGTADPALFGAALPIAGIAGDQQAALVGQACFEPGMAKSTYGTGCFLLLNTGETAVTSANRMLTTAAYRFGGPSRARGARVRGVSDARSHGGHAARWGASRGCHSRRRRHGGERLALPVPRRCARSARRAAEGARDHRPRRRVSRGTRDGSV